MHEKGFASDGELFFMHTTLHEQGRRGLPARTDGSVSL